MTGEFTEYRIDLFPENLKKAIKAKGFTQTGLAKQANLPFETVSKWVRGKSFPRLDSLVLIANVLEISIDELLR
jgi:transcriptional regulator with XRE-family HTH domain